MELETAQALSRLGLLPSRRNDYDTGFDMGSSLSDTQSDFVSRVKQGLGLGSTPGRRGAEAPRRLLDNGELNLGRMAEVAPSPTGSNLVGTPVRLLDLRGDSNLSQFITVTFGVLPVKQFEFDGSDYGGPLVGILEFGNGSAVSQVEIDIRRGTLPYNSGSNPIIHPDLSRILVSPYASVSISIPASSVRVFARNDASYRPYPAPVSDELNPSVKTAMKVMAHVGYGTRPSQFGATRTIWLMRTGTVPAVTDNFFTAIPPFARSFYFQRSSAGAGLFALDYSIRTTSGIVLTGGSIPAGVESPVIPLSGDAENIFITFPAPSAGLLGANLALVYNIGV